MYNSCLIVYLLNILTMPCSKNQFLFIWPVSLIHSSTPSPAAPTKVLCQWDRVQSAWLGGLSGPSSEPRWYLEEPNSKHISNNISNYLVHTSIGWTVITGTVVANPKKTQSSTKSEMLNIRSCHQPVCHGLNQNWSILGNSQLSGFLSCIVHGQDIIAIHSVEKEAMIWISVKMPNNTGWLPCHKQVLLQQFHLLCTARARGWRWRSHCCDRRIGLNIRVISLSMDNVHWTYINRISGIYVSFFKWIFLGNFT